MSRWIKATLLSASLLASGSAPAWQPGQGAAPPAASTAILSRTSTTVTGQPLSLPQPLEVVISVTELPPGGVLPPHRHPWPRYAYVERGRLRVRYEEARLEREFGPGEAVIEAIDQWHEGRVVGAEPVRIVTVDHVPPGQINVVRRP